MSSDLADPDGSATQDASGSGVVWLVVGSALYAGVGLTILGEVLHSLEWLRGAGASVVLAQVVLGAFLMGVFVAISIGLMRSDPAARSVGIWLTVAHFASLPVMNVSWTTAEKAIAWLLAGGAVCAAATFGSPKLMSRHGVVPNSVRAARFILVAALGILVLSWLVGGVQLGSDWSPDAATVVVAVLSGVAVLLVARPGAASRVIVSIAVVAAFVWQLASSWFDRFGPRYLLMAPVAVPLVLWLANDAKPFYGEASES